MSENPEYFTGAPSFRRWLESNHAREEVLWVGYYKVSTGRPSMRWEESVREALCYGWIDGLRKSVDAQRYTIRFTPRRAGSHWSLKNIAMAEELIAEGRMQPAGLRAFRERDAGNSGRASYESREVPLKEEYLEALRADSRAWTFFRELAPGYTRQSVHWVMSARQEATRRRRLRILIDACARGEKIPPLRAGGRD